MRGHLLLQGGAEFKGEMRRSDLKALELSGGADAAVVIVPAAAAPDNNHVRAGRDGERWFRALGAAHVSVPGLIDRPSANDAATAAQLRDSKLIYLLGGFPGHLARTLAGSAAWTAIETALDRGAVLAGSSAGAMVLCDHFYDPVERRVVAGLGLLPGACVLPHHDTFGRHWVARLRRSLPRHTLIGIDESTGAIGDLKRRKWSVYGGGAVTLYRPDGQKTFPEGISFML